MAVKATVLVTRQAAAEVPKGQRQYRKILSVTEGCYHRLCWAHSTAMTSFTSKNQRCWDEWWAVSKCSLMHVLSQQEMSIIFSGQCAKGITLSKQGHCSGPTDWATSPASEASFLYSPPPEPHHCLCQSQHLSRVLLLQRQEGGTRCNTG